MVLAAVVAALGQLVFVGGEGAALVRRQSPRPPDSTWSSRAVSAFIMYSVTTATGGSAVPGTLITVDSLSGVQKVAGWLGETAEQFSLALDPSSGLLFGVNAAINPGEVVKIDPALGGSVDAVAFPQTIQAVAFSPAGQMYAILGTRTLGVIDMSKGTITEVGDIAGGDAIISLDFRSDGTLFAVVVSSQPFKQFIITVNPTTAAVTSSVQAGQLNIGDIACAPDGYIYATNFSWTLLRINPATGSVVAVGQGNLGALGGLAATPGQPLRVVAPNGGETLVVASSKDITWTSSIASSTVKLDYSTDAGKTWLAIAASTPNDGSFTWTIPNQPSKNCLVRVSAISPAGVSDSSDGTFQIVLPNMTAKLSPENALVPVGKSVELSVTTSGSVGTCSYVWTVVREIVASSDGTSLVTETSSPSAAGKLTLQVDKPGLYIVQVAVKDQLNNSASAPAFVGSVTMHAVPGFPTESGAWEYRVFLSWWGRASRWPSFARFEVSVGKPGVTVGTVAPRESAAGEAVTLYETSVGVPTSLKSQKLSWVVYAVTSESNVLWKSSPMDLEMQFMWGVCLDLREITPDLVNGSIKSIDDQIKEMQRLGVGYAKFWMNWDVVNPVIPASSLGEVSRDDIEAFAFPKSGQANPKWGAVDWGVYDRIVRALNAAGISPVPWIAAGDATPRLQGHVVGGELCRVAPFEYQQAAIRAGGNWYWGIGHGDYIDRVKLFAAAAAMRYSSGMMRIVLWNTENELNWTPVHCMVGWRPWQKGKAEDWTDQGFRLDLLKGLQEGIHSGNEADAVTTMNINAGLFGAITLNNPTLAAWDNLLPLTVALYAPYMDVVGIGGYFDYVPIPGVNQGGAYGTAVALAKLLTSKPVIVVEGGRTGVPPPGSTEEKAQDAYLKSAVSSVKASSSGFFWFLLDDRAKNIGFLGVIDEQYWGLVRADGSSKSSFSSYSNLIGKGSSTKSTAEISQMEVLDQAGSWTAFKQESLSAGAFSEAIPSRVEAPAAQVQVSFAKADVVCPALLAVLEYQDEGSGFPDFVVAGRTTRIIKSWGMTIAAKELSGSVNVEVAYSRSELPGGLASEALALFWSATPDDPESWKRASMSQSDPYGCSVSGEVPLQEEHALSLVFAIGYGVGTPSGQVALIVAPNPVTAGGACFYYELPDSATAAQVLVLEPSGALGAQVELDVAQDRYPAAGKWLPVDSEGDTIDNGPYICVLVVDGRVVARAAFTIQK